MNKPRIFFILVAAALFVTGCAAETEETTAGGENIHVTDKGVYYSFQNTEGDEFEAPLLENVPKCTYDFSCLTTDEETGYKSFRDEKNGVTARMGIDVSEFQGEEIDWKQVKKKRRRVCNYSSGLPRIRRVGGSCSGRYV